MGYICKNLRHCFLALGKFGLLYIEVLQQIVKDSLQLFYTGVVRWEKYETIFRSNRKVFQPAADIIDFFLQFFVS